MKSYIKSLAVLSAMAVIGLGSTHAVADMVKESGTMDATYANRNVQPIPDQENHILVLSDATATSKDTSGTGFLDGYKVNIREIADLNRGSGVSQGYVIFSKGSDKLINKIEGNVSTTMKDGQPNTTFKGNWVVVSATGSLAGVEGKGTYSGYFTAEDKFHVEWEGLRSELKDAVAQSKK